MPAAYEKSNELSLLMELRLAFGPGTRLWAYRSREELCYDWLRFKERKTNASFREFALSLYMQERQHATQCPNLSAILRRVASILKAYQVKKDYRMAPSVAVSSVRRASRESLQKRTGPPLPLGRLAIPQAAFPDANSLSLGPPLRENGVAG